MWTLAGGNLSEDDCEDGGDHFQDFDGNDDGNDDEDIVPPIAQSESTDQCLEMLRRIQDMEKRIQDEDNEVKHSDPPQEDAAPGSKDLQALLRSRRMQRSLILPNPCLEGLAVVGHFRNSSTLSLEVWLTRT